MGWTDADGPGPSEAVIVAAVCGPGMVTVTFLIVVVLSMSNFTDTVALIGRSSVGTEKLRLTMVLGGTTVKTFGTVSSYSVKKEQKHTHK